MFQACPLLLAALLAAQPGPPGKGPGPGPGKGPGPAAKGPPGPGGIPGGGPKVGIPGGGPGGAGSLFGPRAGKAGGPPRMTPPAGGPLEGGLKNVRGKLGPDFAKAKTPGDKAALSKKLVDHAGGLKGDPASQLAAFQEAIRTGIESGDITAVFSAIESACKVFDLDEYGAKSSALKELIEDASGDDAGPLGSSAYEAARQAAAYDDYDNAKDLAASAYAAYGKNGDAASQSEIEELKQFLIVAAQQLASARVAEKTVESKPEDTEANLTIGRYLALVKQDWDRGLPYLAKGGSGTLATAARNDLSGSQDAAGQAAIGDLWWQEGEQEKDRQESRSLFRRAGYWYGKSVGKLTGPARAKAEKRLATLKTPAK
jgi:hypothetical protein